jgi:hypothetical protein
MEVLMKSNRFPLLMALALVSVPAVRAAPLAPTKASQLVTVLSSNATCNAGFGLVLNLQSQGDGGVVLLAIPEGSVLVVTDWEWCETSNPSAAFVSLAIEGPSGLIPVSSVHRDSLTAACSRADLGHGVRVSSGSQLCATLVGANGFAKAHGYLTKDK